LEARETPSAGLTGLAHMAPAVHVAKAHKIIRQSHPFKGGGTGTLSSAAPQADGSIMAAVSLSGKATTIGNFSGQLQADLILATTGFTGTATINPASGGSLSLSITTSGGSGTFTVTGGTGKFLNATGHGTITDSVSVVTQSLTFSIKGTVVTVKQR
jgi:hypothetical protein